MVNQKVVTRGKKRVGRGYGSGKGGHTVGRGQKGQKSRNSVGVLFEGVKVKKSLLRRLPLSRGKGKFHSRQKPVTLKLEYLNVFANGTKVDKDALVNAGIVKAEEAAKFGVKVLGGGKLEKKITLSVPASQSVARQIEAAGGTIEV